MKPCCVLLLCLFAFACKPHSMSGSAAAGGSKCAASLALYKTQVDSALAEKTIDQPVYDNQQRHIAKVEKICAAGDEQAALTLLLDAAIALNVGADDAYARSLNKGSDPAVPRGASEK